MTIRYSWNKTVRIWFEEGEAISQGLEKALSRKRRLIVDPIMEVSCEISEGLLVRDMVSRTVRDMESEKKTGIAMTRMFNIPGKLFAVSMSRHWDRERFVSRRVPTSHRGRGGHPRRNEQVGLRWPAAPVEPSEVSSSLSEIASYISLSRRPSTGFVLAQLAAVLLATDKTLAEAVGTALREKVAELMPEQFSGERYDTSLEGKGHKGGYVSWGMQPDSWVADNLIGGILFQCKFDQSKFKSEAPDDGEEWEGHSKGGAVITLAVQAGYYNKRLAGGLKDPVQLGTCTVSIDKMEKVEEAEIDDPGAFKAGVAEIVKNVLNSPPDEALSETKKRRALPPTVSERSLLKWLLEKQRTDVKRSELNALVKNISEAKDRAPGTVLQEVNQFFKGRGFPVDEAA